jgi:hypothetical protein
VAREISRAESWERAHEVFSQINFNSFDYNTIKDSLLDYTKLYYPEDFNDYIESSEFVAILELFAYSAEILAYRIDLNAHENFISTAQRKESVLRLAKLLSYKASRNIPARGLVKLTSIQTTETLVDSQGRNLAGRQILWNDVNNADWKEQFLLVMNRVLEQEFGTVAPNERVQVEDVLFELYSWNNTSSSLSTTAIKYNANVSNASFGMELVPVQLDSFGPSEKRPERSGKFTLLYGTDGLGDGSDSTGFFLYTKQGDLRVREEFFDGITPNQTLDINQDNINDTDVWINLVEPDSRQIIVTDPYERLLPHLVSEDLRYGEWVEVDLANAQNILFNTNKNRHKYEIETLDDDRVRLVFGDGEFSDVPSGSFDVWYRVSVNEDIVIPKSAIIDENATFSYLDATNSVQTLSFAFSLVSALQNNSPSEDLEHIRRVAPSVYYTQDRMVNGRDYNTFMLQDPSILKLRSVNRTFAGDSKFIAWHDPKEYYENVKLFGDDLALYWDERDPGVGGLVAVNGSVSASSLLTNFLQPLLCNTDFFAKLGPILESRGSKSSDLRCEFTNKPYSFDINDNEILSITTALNAAQTTTPVVDLYYSVIYDEWTVGVGSVGHACDIETSLPPHIPPVISGCSSGIANSIWMIRVEARFVGSTLSGWDVRWRTRRFISHSTDIRFWHTNNSNRVINFDTLNSNLDNIVVLSANTNAEGTGILGTNRKFTVLGQELVEQNLPNAGLPDQHKLSVLPVDVNNDGIPDNLLQPILFDATISKTYQQCLDLGLVVPDGGVDPDDQTLIFPEGRKVVVSGKLDIEVEIRLNGSLLTFSNLQLQVAPSSAQDVLIDRVVIDDQLVANIGNTLTPTDIIEFTFIDYVYFKRESSVDEWLPQSSSDEIKTLWALDNDLSNTTIIDSDDQRYKRHPGRYPLNFGWFHTTPRFHLIDPSPTNINDIFIITRGYFTSTRRYLENRTSVVPVAPTPLELRTAYKLLLGNKMISDSVVLHSGTFKLLFGSRAIPELRATFKVIRPVSSSLTDNEVKVRIVERIRGFFDINDWNFGETFYATELYASVHADVGPEIDSIVIVPSYSQNQFGDLFQIQSREDEMFLPDINTTDIEIVQSYTSVNIRQNEN